MDNEKTVSKGKMRQREKKYFVPSAHAELMFSLSSANNGTFYCISLVAYFKVI